MSRWWTVIIGGLVLVMMGVVAINIHYGDKHIQELTVRELLVESRLTELEDKVRILVFQQDVILDRVFKEETDE